jgi:hypothetical protein
MRVDDVPPIRFSSTVDAFVGAATDTADVYSCAPIPNAKTVQHTIVVWIPVALTTLVCVGGAKGGSKAVNTGAAVSTADMAAILDRATTPHTRAISNAVIRRVCVAVATLVTVGMAISFAGTIDTRIDTATHTARIHQSVTTPDTCTVLSHNRRSRRRWCSCLVVTAAVTAIVVWSRRWCWLCRRYLARRSAVAVSAFALAHTAAAV